MLYEILNFYLEVYQTQIVMSAQNPMDKKKFLQMMNITVEQLFNQRKKIGIIGKQIEKIEKLVGIKLVCPFIKVK